MDWHRQVDIYCERLGPEFWAEPLNAITNAAFIIAGIAGVMMARQAARHDLAASVLAILVIIIGIGSFLFHSFATRWAGLADVAPIMLFILGYFTVVMNRFVGLSWAASVLATAGWLAALVGMAVALNLIDSALAGLSGVESVLAGAKGYLPALIGLWAVGAWLDRVREHPAGAQLRLAAGIFAASLAFRTFDMPACPAIPIGTHFLWHCLNALLLFVLVRAVIRHGRISGSAPAPA